MKRRKDNLRLMGIMEEKREEVNDETEVKE
jgi:hypothetical protein